MNASVRGQIPELPKDEGSRYIHNAFLPLCAPALAIKDAKDMSPTDIALHIRHTVIEQRTPEDLAKVLPLYREMARRGEYPGYFDCTGSGHHVTSWVAGGLGVWIFLLLSEGKGVVRCSLLAVIQRYRGPSGVRHFALLCRRIRLARAGIGWVWALIRVCGRRLRSMLRTLFAQQRTQSSVNYRFNATKIRDRNGHYIWR